MRKAPEPAGLEITQTRDSEIGAVVLELRGTATYHQAPELRRRLFEAMDETPDRLIIELGGIEHMDSIATAVLVEGMLRARVNGSAKLFICSPSEAVRKVFKLSGLTEALARCEDCRTDLSASLREGLEDQLDAHYDALMRDVAKAS